MKNPKDKKTKATGTQNPGDFFLNIHSFIWKIPSISTITPAGSPETPKALRVPTPASSPNTSLKSSLQPLITWGC
jgi:hypothetical protein